MTEAERIHRGTLTLAMTLAALLAWLSSWLLGLPGWFAAAGFAFFFLWHLCRYVFTKPKPRQRYAPGTTFTVADASGFPQGRFQVKIDDESYEVKRTEDQ